MVGANKIGNGACGCFFKGFMNACYSTSPELCASWFISSIRIATKFQFEAAPSKAEADF